jgi:hypothetical protein
MPAQLIGASNPMYGPAVRGKMVRRFGGCGLASMYFPRRACENQPKIAHQVTHLLLGTVIKPKVFNCARIGL